MIGSPHAKWAFSVGPLPGQFAKRSHGRRLPAGDRRQSFHRSSWLVWAALLVWCGVVRGVCAHGRGLSRLMIDTIAHCGMDHDNNSPFVLGISFGVWISGIHCAPIRRHDQE